MPWTPRQAVLAPEEMTTDERTRLKMNEGKCFKLSAEKDISAEIVLSPLPHKSGIACHVPAKGKAKKEESDEEERPRRYGRNASYTPYSKLQRGS